jgi:hypothetical protein
MSLPPFQYVGHELKISPVLKIQPSISLEGLAILAVTENHQNAGDVG